MAWVGTKRCVLGCVFALGCGNDDGNDGATSAADDESDTLADDAPSVESSDGSGPATESSVSDDDTSADDSMTETDPSVSSDGTDTSADSTTGEDQYCGLTDLEGGPWFELSHHGAPLDDGGTLTIECGPQGSLMFYIETQQGGWIPPEENIYFAVTIDVDGVVGPTGHFFEVGMYGQYIGCDEFDGGGAPTGFFVIPPDGVDPHMLDGLSATVHIELLAEGNPTWDGTVLLEVPIDDASIDGCGG